VVLPAVWYVDVVPLSPVVLGNVEQFALLIELVGFLQFLNIVHACRNVQANGLVSKIHTVGILARFGSNS
jgi:hypothetical protein